MNYVLVALIVVTAILLGALSIFSALTMER